MTQNSESRTTPANELTAEQQSTLEKLHSNEAAILLRFDQVLAEFGIDRHVHQFTTARERTREIKDLQFVDFKCQFPTGPTVPGIQPRLQALRS